MNVIFSKRLFIRFLRINYYQKKQLFIIPKANLKNFGIADYQETIQLALKQYS